MIQLYELKVIDHFSAAHQLRRFHGECENLHGHNWKVEVCVASYSLDEKGMVLDFRVVKKHTKEVLSRLDHKFLNELTMFRDQNPSAENIARYIAEELGARLDTPERWVTSVTAWESETACVTYVRKSEK